MTETAIKIDQKIVNYAVKKENTEQPKDTIDLEHLHEATIRPEMLLGATYKIKIGTMENAIYLTINDIVLNSGTDHEERRIYEVFLNSKDMSQFQWIALATRLMSAVFRKGGDAVFIVDELKQIFDPNGGMWEKGINYPSLVAKIGSVIERHMVTIGMIKRQVLSEHQQAIVSEKLQEFRQKHGDEVSDDGYPKQAVKCYKCGERSMIRLDNCLTCISFGCGESKCQ